MNRRLHDMAQRRVDFVVGDLRFSQTKLDLETKNFFLIVDGVLLPYDTLALSV
jgi:hypothetical protein